MARSDEVSEAVGVADAPEDAEIEALKAELAAPSETEQKAQRLAQLEAERAGKRAAQFAAVAAKRQIGIRRAAGSVAAELEEDAQRFVAACEAVVAAVQTINQRYAQYGRFVAEDGVLADRFGLPASDLAQVSAPGLRADVFAAFDGLRNLWIAERADTTLQVETDETGLRSRRTYREIEGTPGHAIVMAAGPPEFPPLTLRQQELIAERDADRARMAAHAKAQADVLADAFARIQPQSDGLRQS